MGAKHTPGPRKTAATDDSLIVAGRTKIASTYEVEGDVWGEANARLIASAPDLLEALQSLVANLAEGDFISETRIDAARAAIARATGEAA